MGGGGSKPGSTDRANVVCGECAGTGEMCGQCRDEKRLPEIREVLRVGFGPRWAQGATKPVLYDAAADLLGMLDAERTRSVLLRGIIDGHVRKSAIQERDISNALRDLNAAREAAAALKAAHADAERDLAEAHARAEGQRKKIAELRRMCDEAIVEIDARDEEIASLRERVTASNAWRDEWQRECEFSRRAHDRLMEAVQRFAAAHAAYVGGGKSEGKERAEYVEAKRALLGLAG